MIRLGEVLGEPSLATYTYSYPHKTAHRPLHRPARLRDLWATEDRSSLFLYLHVPFCENRCGYCNLFSLKGAESELISRYLDAIARQAERVREALCDAHFARLAVGGGTPTLLPPPELEQLLAVTARILGASAVTVPASVEVSPATAIPDKLIRMRQFGIGRLSIGVQTFDPDEAVRLGRPQSRELVEQALHEIRAVGFPVLNVDLMYDIPGQTAESWRKSLRAALAWRPEEIFLYPLYIRPMTSLATRAPKSRLGEWTPTVSDETCSSRKATSNFPCGCSGRLTRRRRIVPHIAAWKTAWSVWAAELARTPVRCTTPRRMPLAAALSGS